MKNLRLFIIISACFLLIGCGTTQEKVGESPEEIKQALSEGNLIKPGDWIRATTNDEQIHEFSFVAMREDELHGGDVILPVAQIKQLEVFPLKRQRGIAPMPKMLMGNEQFNTQFLEHIKTAKRNIDKLTLESGIEIYNVYISSVDNGIIVGQGSTIYDTDHMPYTKELKVPISNVQHVFDIHCKGRFLDKICLHSSFSKWSESEEERLRTIQDGKVLKAGDWVRVSLKSGIIQEFQYRELQGDVMAGGDGLIPVANIESMEIYPVQVTAPDKMTAGEAAGTGIAAVLASGFLILLYGAAFVVVPP